MLYEKRFKLYKIKFFYHVLKNMFSYEGKVFKSKIRFVMQPLPNPP